MGYAAGVGFCAGGLVPAAAPQKPVRPGGVKRKAVFCLWGGAGRGGMRGGRREMSGMSGFGVVCLYSENRAKAPAGGKGRRGMAGQGKSGEKKTMRDILSAFLRMPAPESALGRKDSAAGAGARRAAGFV